MLMNNVNHDDGELSEDETEILVGVTDSILFHSTPIHAQYKL